jgi:hypothetical protein
MTDTFLPRVGGVLSADIAVPEHEQDPVGAYVALVPG